MKSTIDILPDGSVRCLFTEMIPLCSLGRLKVRRASLVEFHEGRQLWLVKSNRGRKVLYASKSRQSCLLWESENFDKLAR